MTRQLRSRRPCPLRSGATTHTPGATSLDLARISALMRADARTGRDRPLVDQGQRGPVHAGPHLISVTRCSSKRLARTRDDT